MARERLRQPSLPEAISDVLGDFAVLFRNELRLARAELSSKLSAKVRGWIWLALACLFGVLAFALTLGALVAWITTLNVSLHSAFFIVAASVAMLAVLAYFAGHNEAQAELTPTRTIQQVKRDIEITKEQFT